MNERRLDRLERLQKLRETGALDDAEFRSEKRRLLLNETESLRSPRAWLAYAVIGASVLLAAIAVGFWATKDVETPRPKAAPMHLKNNPVPPTVVPVTTLPRSDADRLGDAFQAATGHRAKFSRIENGELVTTSPIRIVQLPFGFALLTKREIKDGCHACSGAIGVYYFREEAGQTSVTGRWPKAVETLGWGYAPTNWHLTNSFTTYPAIYAEGGYTAQGITESGASITELRPNGPIASEWIHTRYSDDGVFADDSERKCEVAGRIANVRKDQFFDVIVSGSVTGVDRYAKTNGKFVPKSKLHWDLPCGS